MLYAAYGSNINQEQMKRRCPDSSIFDTGMIQDHELAFCKVATLIPSEGMQAPTLVWSISENDEKMLDSYEGYPHKYIKQKIPVKINDEIINVTAYIMKDSSHIQTPSESYVQKILQGYDKVGFDTSYVDDAYDNAIEEEYGEEVYSYEDDGQYSIFDSVSTPYIDEKMQKAFVVGMAFAPYEDSLSFSAGERQRVMNTIINKHDVESRKISLYNYADAYFQLLLEKSNGCDISRNKPQEQKTLYVAYGSNINLQQMASRCPNSKPVCAATLEDYKLVFCGCADCQPKKGEYTPVLVWEINEKDWPQLDMYEGYPNYYTKKKVEVNGHGEATIYVMTKENAVNKRPPSPGYYKGIQNGYLQNNMDLSKLQEALNESIALEEKSRKNYNRGGKSL